MAAAAREMDQSQTQESAWTSAAALAVLNVDGCESAALSIVRRRPSLVVHTEGATDDLAVTADRLQYETGEGPCLDAIWNQPVVRSPGLGDDPRWPAWGPMVVESTGAHSVMSVRVFTDDNLVGALTMYSTQRDAFTDHDELVAVALAAHVAVALVARQRIDTLNLAVDARTVSGQAIGILMERYNLDQESALALLRRISSTQNTKVSQISRELVDTGLLRGMTRSAARAKRRPPEVS